MTLLLSNEDVDRLLSMREAIDVLEVAYRELAAGKGVNRRRSDSLVPTTTPGALYSLKSMDGVAPSAGVSAIRIDSDVITWPTRAGNARREKVPAAGGRWVGLVLLFSTETGEPLAIMPDGYLQRLRVGATNGIAAKYLARHDSRVVGLLGSGWQAGGQIMAICAVRGVATVRVYSTDRARREAFAREWSARLRVEVIPVASPEEAVRGADVVLCATNTIEHILFARHVAPGMHLSSIKRQELEPEAVRRADRVVVHTHEGSPMTFVQRGVAVPEEAKGGAAFERAVDIRAFPELPDLVAARVPGRRGAEEVTCFLNNVGMGYQFAAVGGALWRKAKAAGAGREIPTEWLTQDVHP